MSKAPFTSNEFDHGYIIPACKKQAYARGAIVFFLRHNKYLCNNDFYRENIWTPAVQLRLSSRRWPDHMTLLYDYDGHICSYEGELVVAPDMHDLFGEDEGAWFRKFLNADASGCSPATYRNNRKDAVERLVWIEVFLRIRRFDNDEDGPQPPALPVFPL